MKEIKQLDDYDKIMELPISYEEKGKEIGEKEGIRKVALEMLGKGMDVELITK